METITKKRSESLTIAQANKLRAYREKFETSVACAASIGIDRNVLERVLLTGSGSPDTVAKIRQAINKKAA